MKKEELLELARKLGIKDENFEFSYENNPKKLEEQIITGATFMGYLGVKEEKK